jgi:hypothetical protein
VTSATLVVSIFFIESISRSESPRAGNITISQRDCDGLTHRGYANSYNSYRYLMRCPRLQKGAKPQFFWQI